MKFRNEFRMRYFETFSLIFLSRLRENVGKQREKIETEKFVGGRIRRGKCETKSTMHENSLAYSRQNVFISTETELHEDIHRSNVIQLSYV
jgi:hypothetical protein